MKLFETIMTFFGINPSETFEIWAMARDYNTYCLIKKMRHALFLSDHKEAELLIIEMEKNKKFSKGLNLQFLIRAKTALAHVRKEEAKKIIELIYQGLKISKKLINTHS